MPPARLEMAFAVDSGAQELVLLAARRALHTREPAATAESDVPVAG